MSTDLRAALRQVADEIDLAQRMYHRTLQNWPQETEDTCEAGMCGTYRAWRDGILAATDSSVGTPKPAPALDVEWHTRRDSLAETLEAPHGSWQSLADQFQYCSDERRHLLSRMKKPRWTIEAAARRRERK